jgi:hypothetical protein
MIERADFLYLAEEPASFAMGAVQQLQRAGMCVLDVPMIQNSRAVMDALRASRSDAVVFISPYQYQHFMRECLAELRTLGKPLISYISEHTFGNLLDGYEQFEREQNWADHYFCSQDCDTLAMHKLGKRATTAPSWVATDIFRPGPPLAERIQRFCFVGHTQDYVPGMYAERRRVLAAFQRSGCLDILNIPRSPATVHEVARAYASYAGVLCPPSNGRAHSIRLYEAAACGALLLDVGQPMDEGNRWFRDGQHCITLAAGLSNDDLAAFAPIINFPRHQDLADRARDFCRSAFTPEAVWQEIFRIASL